VSRRPVEYTGKVVSELAIEEANMEVYVLRLSLNWPNSLLVKELMLTPTVYEPDSMLVFKIIELLPIKDTVETESLRGSVALLVLKKGCRIS
jgi:hypothetical protein